jgi:hypothetical protein
MAWPEMKNAQVKNSRMHASSQLPSNYNKTVIALSNDKSQSARVWSLGNTRPIRSDFVIPENAL